MTRYPAHPMPPIASNTDLTVGSHLLTLSIQVARRADEHETGVMG
jgi:hypothetical protein